MNKSAKFILAGVTVLTASATPTQILANNEESNIVTTGSSASKSLTTTYKLTSEPVNLRESASWSANKLEVIPGKTTVSVLSESGEWAKTNFRGKIGYIPVSYLRNLSAENIKTASEAINIRGSASWSGTKLGVIPKGDKMYLLSNEGEWSKVTYNATVGYVPSSYIGLGGQTNTPTTTKTATEALNLRKSASWSAEQIDVIPKGAKVSVISESGEWSNVNYNNKNGYVASKYLTSDNSSNNGGSSDNNLNIESMNKTGTVVNLKAGDTLAVRALPHYEATEIGRLSMNASVTITGKDRDSDWYRINYNGKTGYVNGYYIKINSSTPSYSYKKTTTDLNMRSGPSIDNSIILTIPSGTSVKVLSSSNGWDKVEYNGKTGYCNNKYLTSTNEAPTVKKITTANLNLRSGPSTSNSIIKTVPQGTVVDVLSTSGEWDKVKVGGQTGYMSNQYLELYTGSSGSGGGGSLPPSNPSYGRRKVVIDAGHGGHDSGAVGFGRKEKDLALSISKKVNSKLKTLGFNTIMTRSTDVYIPLSERYNIANRNGADMFVSIHLNSGSSSAYGLETLYKNYKNFANDLQTELINATGARNRGLKYRSDLAVLNGTKMPSALVETGFISNSGESSQLASNSYQETLATAIARGVAKYANKLN